VALTEKGELEAEGLVKKRECDFVKEEEISITTPAGPAGNFGNRANYAHMGEGTQV